MPASQFAISFVPVDRAERYSERNAQKLTNAIAKMRRDGAVDSEPLLRSLILELNHVGSVLQAGGACDRVGN
jgi:hypothetical protein